MKTFKYYNFRYYLQLFPLYFDYLIYTIIYAITPVYGKYDFFIFNKHLLKEMYS